MIIFYFFFLLGISELRKAFDVQTFITFSITKRNWSPMRLFPHNINSIAFVIGVAFLLFLPFSIFAVKYVAEPRVPSPAPRS